MTARTLMVAALGLLAAACGEERDAPTEPVATAAPSTNPAAEARIAAAKVVADADGFAVSGDDAPSPMRFGADRIAVDAAAEQALRAPMERSSNQDCGAGPMEFTQIGQFQLAYQDGKFVGWVLRGAGDDVVTIDGVGPGLSLAQLQEWRPVRVIADSTLDGEFEYQSSDGGIITGFFEGSQSDGRIVALQAGLNCFFR